MNLRDLEYLVAVANLRSFSQAADKCCVSQPNLSGQIKKLEDELGVQLFERTNKRVLPTEIGKAIILSAQKILREADVIRETAENSHDPLAGRFRLGAFPTLSTYIFPELVSRVKKALPRLRLILVEEKTATLLEKLKTGELDAALLALPVHDDSLSSKKLFTDAFHLAAPPDHPLAQMAAIDQEMLVQHKLLLLEEGHCLREQALDVCRATGMAEEEDFRATGLETLRQMVKAGTGITLMPEIAIDKKETGIRYVPFRGAAPFRTIGLVWRKTSARQKAVQAVYGELSGLGSAGSASKRK